MAIDYPIAAVSGDPGGAEAIAPVLAALTAQGATVHAYAYRQAQAVWTSRSLAYETLPERFEGYECTRLLEERRPELVLVSTSVNGVNLEKKFTAAARALGIPSLAVLDMWANYRRRFSDESGHLAFLPDRIAVMDERAKKEMAEEGIDTGLSIVTGQPAFEEIAAWRAAAPDDLRATLRGALGLAETDLLVVFGSQPVSAVVGPDPAAPGHIGFTEHTVLAELVHALEALAATEMRPITLLVRPHPRESEESFAGLSSSRVAVRVTSRYNRREIALAADLVTGMNSAFLIEASCLGCRTVSLQPGLRQPDSLPASGFGVIHKVYLSDEIRPTLARLLSDGQSAMDFLEPADCLASPPPAATQNIIELIDHMVQQQKQQRSL